MTDASEVDPDELRADLDQIKGALGLQERRPGMTSDWLVFGVFVALAGFASQGIELQGLPGYYHPIVWFGAMGAAAVLSRAVIARDAEEAPVDRPLPSVGFVYGAQFAAWIALQVLLGPTIDAAEGPAASYVFGLSVILVGAAYLLVGQTLKAYHIRRRDRTAFYVGGAWMLALGAAVPHVSVLEQYVYGIYGGLYLAYALATYGVLTRT